MDYPSLFTQAWQIVRRQRSLWFYGLLVAIFEGGVGSQIRVSGGNGSPFSGQQATWTQIAQIIPWILLTIFVLWLAFALLWLVLTTTGRGGLFIGADLASREEEAGIGTIWEQLRPRLPSLIVLQFVTSLPIIVGAFIVGAVVAAFVAAFFMSGREEVLALDAPFLIATGIPAVLIMILVLALLGIAVQLFQTIALMRMVYAETNLGETLRESTDLLASRLGSVVIIWLILLVVGGVVSIAAAVPILVVVVAIGLSLAAGLPMLAPGFLLIGFPLIVIGFGVGALYQAYRYTVWSLAYKQWMPAPSSGE